MTKPLTAEQVLSMIVRLTTEIAALETLLVNKGVISHSDLESVRKVATGEGFAADLQVFLRDLGSAQEGQSTSAPESPETGASPDEPDPE